MFLFCVTEFVTNWVQITGISVGGVNLLEWDNPDSMIKSGRGLNRVSKFKC